MSERTAEEWGKVAVGLPGWRWMAGMLRVLAQSLADRFPLTATGLPDRVDEWNGSLINGEDDGQPTMGRKPGEFPILPDPDDPATAGCLLAMLGDTVARLHYLPATRSWAILLDAEGMPRTVVGGEPIIQPTLGRACIAAAEALGRWPGGGDE